MAKDKNSFLLYSDMIETFESLDDETAGKLIKHVFKYVNDLEPEIEDPLIKIAFIPIKQALKRDLKKYEKLKVEKSNAGVVGNLKRWHNDIYKDFKANKITLEQAVDLSENRKTSQSDKSIAKIAVSDSVIVSDSVSVIDSDSNKKESKEKKDIKNVNPPQIDFERLKNYYNKNRGNLPECKILSNKRKKAIKARVKEYGLESVKKMIDATNESEFLQGENRQGWTANFDWIFNKSNFIKIIEGNYKNKLQNGKSTSNTNDITQPTIGRQSFEVIRKNSGGW